MKTYEQMKEEEDLILDSSDREKLDSYSEIQREKILYERYNKLKLQEERKILQTMGKSTANQIEKSKESQIKFEDCDFIVDRKLLVDNIFKPNIDSFKGTFLRIKINKNYLIAKIVGFTECNAYSLPYNNGSCIIGVNIDSGKKIYKGIEITNVSSQKLTEEEFEEFIKNFSIKKINELKAQYQRLIAEMTRDLTNEEITKMIQNKLKSNPKKQSNTELKISYILKRDQAINNKDKSMAQHYQKLLEEIEDQEKELKRKRHFEELKESKKRLQNK